MNGAIHAEAVVRSGVPEEGMGAKFTKLGATERALLEQLLKRLLQ